MMSFLNILNPQINLQLLLLVTTPFFFIGLLLILKKQFDFFIKDFLQKATIIGLLFIFFISLTLWVTFDSSITTFQYFTLFNLSNNFGLDLIFGLDGFSLFFVLLVTFLAPLCVI